MKVGLPGVGIGGVFYLLLVAWMPLRELWLTVRGRSTARRWRRVGVQLALAGSILAGLWAEWWAMARLPGAAAAWSPGPAPPDLGAAAAGLGASGLGALPVVQVTLEHMAPALAVAPFAIIALIVAGLHLLRLAARRAAAPRSTAAAAPAGGGAGISLGGAAVPVQLRGR